MYDTNKSARRHWLDSTAVIPVAGSKSLGFREDLIVLGGQQMLWPYRFILPHSLNKSSLVPFPSSIHPLPPFLRHISLHWYSCSVAFSYRYTHFCFMQSPLWEHFFQHLHSWNKLLWICSPKCLRDSSVCNQPCTPLCLKNIDSKTAPHSWSLADSVKLCV